MVCGSVALLVAGIGVVSAGSVAGVSFALTSSSAPTALRPAAAPHECDSRARRPVRANRRQRVQAILRRSVHGEIELADQERLRDVRLRPRDGHLDLELSITRAASGRPVGDRGDHGSTHMPKRGAPTKGQNVVLISVAATPPHRRPRPFRPVAGDLHRRVSSASWSAASGLDDYGLEVNEKLVAREPERPVRKIRTGRFDFLRLRAAGLAGYGPSDRADRR